MEKDKLVFGFVEEINIIGVNDDIIFDPVRVVAKVDTGAFSGVVHATDIIEDNGVLSFKLLGKKNIKTTNYRFFMLLLELF